MPNWVQTIDIHRWTKKYPVAPNTSTKEGRAQLAELRDGIVVELKRIRQYRKLMAVPEAERDDLDLADAVELTELIEELSNVTDREDFTAVMRAVLPWCDENRVWTSGC